MDLLDWNMSYKNLNTLIGLFQEIDSASKPVKFIWGFNDLPQTIALSGKKIDENVYASVNYQSDQDDGVEPDAPIIEAYVTIRIVHDLPEEKSRAEVVDAQWLFTASGITQTRGELSDLMVFFEMLP